MTNTIRLGLVLLVAIVGFVVVGSPLAAHSEVRTRAPEAGQVVREVDHIDILFFTPIASGEISLEGPDGTPIDVGPTTLSNSGLITSVAFDRVTEPGAYRVTHSELAADGDSQEAQFGFIVDPDSEGTVATLFDRDDGPNWPLLGLIGGVLLVLVALFAPRRERGGD